VRALSSLETLDHEPALPNWCHNVLTITGPADELEAFAEQVRPTPAMKKRDYELDHRGRTDVPPFEQWFTEHYGHAPLSFAAFTPQPEDGDDRHSWCDEHWGTKWDANFGPPGAAVARNETADVETSVAANGVIVTPTVVAYRFETAWSPPIEAVAAMAAGHPKLRFHLRYGEPGEGYAGEASFADGELEDERDLDVDEVLAPEETWF
jgi:hypothetical protein